MKLETILSKYSDQIGCKHGHMVLAGSFSRSQVLSTSSLARSNFSFPNFSSHPIGNGNGISSVR